MRILLLLILLFSGLSSYGQKKQVCFTFDDLPVVSYGKNDTCYQKSLTDKLVQSLKEDRIPAIGFVNERKLYDNGKRNPFQVNMLKSWLDNGLEIGNHTFSHPDYNSVSFEKYSADILRGEVITKELLANNGRTIKYFRHPFLHVGNTKAKADSLNTFLLEHAYTVAPVTIDNDDYLFALAYKRAQDKKEVQLMQQIGLDYIDYMEQKLKYYERQSNALFGRHMPQILLLHANLLNSDYIALLAEMFRRNNYEFVSLDKVLEDKAYESAITVFGNWGISWIDKWALTRGEKGVFFKDEPATPEYIKKLSE